MAYSFTTGAWNTTSGGESFVEFNSTLEARKFCVSISCAACDNFIRLIYGALITAKLEDMLSDWKVSKERVYLVIRANASNMEREIKDADVHS